WWFAPFVGIIGFWSKLSISKVSAASFSGIFLVWFGLSMLFDSMNASLLSQKVAQILQIPNRMWLITTASTLVATVGSMAAVTGALLRKIINV
ncbi:MAG TPA: hypothetical protein PKD56_12955, partial [Chitinophagales bacterium]|nr:hypothetical protein [Chitinophagales bacterium]